MTRRRAGRRGAKQQPPPITDDDVTLATGERLHRWDYFTPLAWELTVDLKREPALGDRWVVRGWGPTAVLLEERSTRRERWVRSLAKRRRLKRHLGAAAPEGRGGA